MLQCMYIVKYYDYALVPIGEIANPAVREIVRKNVSWENVSTLIVGEAAKFVNELADAGKTAFIDRIEKTFIIVKYYEGKIDRFRRFYFENYDDDDADYDDDMEDYED